MRSPVNDAGRIPMSTPVTNHNRLTLGFAGLVIVASLSGALYMKRVADARTPGGSEGDAEPLPAIRVAEVTARSVPIVFDVRGFLSGFAEVAVHSEVSGRVIAKPVSDGQLVEAGAVLCAIDDTFYSLAVQKAEANVGVAQGQLREAQSAIAVAEAQRHDAQAVRDNAAAEFARIRDLYRDEDSVRIEYERYETQFERAEAQLRCAEAAYARTQDVVVASRAAVQVADSTLAEARETWSRCQVSAPISGTIDRTAYEIGEYVVAGQPLVEIMRLDRMKLTVELTGPQIGTLGDRSRAEVSVDAVSGVTYPAVLSHVAPKADPLTRKFRVEFHLENPEGRLRAGMFARARIQSATWTNTLVAPRDAFFRQFGARFCLLIVEEEGTPVARLRRVTVEDIPGRMEWVRVTEGLAPGDRIVIKRPRNLKDGTAVNVSEVEPVNLEGPAGS